MSKQPAQRSKGSETSSVGTSPAASRAQAAATAAAKAKVAAPPAVKPVAVKPAAKPAPKTPAKAEAHVETKAAPGVETVKVVAKAPAKTTAPKAPAAKGSKPVAEPTKPAATKPGAFPGAVTKPSEISNYSAAVRWLLDRTDIERMRVVKYNDDTFKLDRMRALLAKLGNPHEQFRSVHVAGTNGKGSTTAMLAAMLQECGYAVGLYTSPHLVDLRERIQINGVMIEKSDFTDLMKEVAEAAAKIDGEPTFFEIVTAVGFLYFAERAVDIAIIEVGLGGRLDSTNVVRPEASIITSIDYDHTKLLGATLPEIAKEKAGIFKKDVPAFIFEKIGRAHV